MSVYRSVLGTWIGILLADVITWNRPSSFVLRQFLSLACYLFQVSSTCGTKYTNNSNDNDDIDEDDDDEPTYDL